MPELPEVETIRRVLAAGSATVPSLTGQTIQNAEVFWQGSIANPTAGSFSASVAGREVRALDRRGKFLILNLDQGSLIFHLRMSGDLRMSLGGAPAAHDRLRLHFRSGWGLTFTDPRKFGRVWLVSDPTPILAGLGPEPLDESLSTEAFGERLRQHSRQLKPLLMDQHFLAGLGNIYTDEALFLARLHPLRLSSTLSQAEAERLLAAIRQTLRDGISHNGSSIDWVYRGGNFQNHFKVYQRTGQVCPVCGHTIEKIRVGQRGTHFCPVCQPYMKD